MNNLDLLIKNATEEISMELVMNDYSEKILFEKLLVKIRNLAEISAAGKEKKHKAIYSISKSAAEFIGVNICLDSTDEKELLAATVKAVKSIQELTEGGIMQGVGMPGEITADGGPKSLNVKINELIAKIHEISSAASGCGNTAMSDASFTMAAIIEKTLNNPAYISLDEAKAINCFIEAVRDIGMNACVKPDKNMDDNANKCQQVPGRENSDNNLNESCYTLSGDETLLKDFIAEAGEHTEAADSQLLILEKNNTNAEAINTVFRCFHTLKSLSSFLELHDIFALVKEAEGMLHKVRKGDLVLGGQEMDVLFEIVDMLKKQVRNLKEAVLNSRKMKIESGLNGLLAGIWNVCGKTTPQDVVAPFINAKTAVPGDNLTGAVPVTTMRNTNPYNAVLPRTQIKEMLRIDSEKFDRLIDTIGEIVIAESMIKTDSIGFFNAPEVYIRNLGHLNKTTKRLHELGLSLRLIPLKALFQKMARIVRDLARKHDKEIDFIVTGEDTEIDRTVVEKISDPLVHMLRNAVDHGIETRAERKETKKPAAAVIRLNAYHKGGSVYIEVSDDGKGLDREKIVKRAADNGLISSEIRYADSEIYNLIFKPGFSTSSVVTDTSGRGVGMDVVKKNVEELHGKIDIMTENNAGVKFTISMPLTTAIIEAMVIRLGDEKFLLPTLSIIESVKANPKTIFSVAGKGLMLSLRGQLIPVFSLKKFFGKNTGIVGESDNGIIVIIEDENRKAGIIVDELINQQQVVVKSLGAGIGKMDGIGGCTIMPDGKVGLIIDAATIIQLAMKREEVKQ